MADELQTTRFASLIHNLDDIPVHKMPFGEMKVLGGDQVMGFWRRSRAAAKSRRIRTPTSRSPG